MILGAEGRLHADKIDAIADPPSLVDLRRRLEGMLPRVDLPDLIEVMAWHPGFVAAFAGVSGGRSRLADLHVTIAAALTAHALNVGYVPVISEGVPALTRGRISHVDQNYLRPENYTAANSVLIAAQDDIALARQWGGGLVAGIDGMRFVVPVRSIHARPNPKYFGRRRGATWLNMLNDQAVGLAGRVLSGTPRDSLHMIDLIYSQDAGQRPDVIITDTGSYSDIVFALDHAARLRLPPAARRPARREAVAHRHRRGLRAAERRGARQNRPGTHRAAVAGHLARRRFDSHRRRPGLRHPQGPRARRHAHTAG